MIFLEQVDTAALVNEINTLKTVMENDKLMRVKKDEELCRKTDEVIGVVDKKVCLFQAFPPISSFSKFHIYINFFSHSWSTIYLKISHINALKMFVRFAPTFSTFSSLSMVKHWTKSWQHLLQILRSFNDQLRLRTSSSGDFYSKKSVDLRTGWPLKSRLAFKLMKRLSTP